MARRAHDGMPVVLGPGEETTWLRGDLDRARDRCDPYDGAMEAYAVSEAVNAPANDRPGVVRPLDEWVGRGRPDPNDVLASAPVGEERAARNGRGGTSGADGGNRRPAPRYQS